VYGQIKVDRYRQFIARCAASGLRPASSRSYRSCRLLRQAYERSKPDMVQGSDWELDPAERLAIKALEMYASMHAMGIFATVSHKMT
jgi:hypothetical protein